MNIELTSEVYALKIGASKRELQELSYIVSKYIEDESHTSGDNPAWSFMKKLNSVLEQL
jgi:hypothetical protein